MWRQLLPIAIGHLLIVGSAFALGFRPPAIPLLTTDPFTQTWIRGDASTSTQVTHWDGTEKQMIGYIRVDGDTFQYLGACTPKAVSKPGPTTTITGHDISPGGEIDGPSVDEQECNKRCYNLPACQAYVMTPGPVCHLKSAIAPVVSSPKSNASILTGPHPKCDPGKQTKQVAVHALPTRTVFELEVNGKVSLNVTFLSTMFTTDLVRLSRPVYYVGLEVRALDGRPHSVQVYFDASAQHAVNNCDSQDVTWSSWSLHNVHGVQLGNAIQRPVGSKGDGVNIDWGYLHLATTSSAPAPWAGSAAAAREAFRTTGQLPAAGDVRRPRKCADDLPALATAFDFGRVAGSKLRHTVLLAYDDVKSVNYFGDLYAGYWTHAYDNISHAVSASADEYDVMLKLSVSHDNRLLDKLARYGEKYAALCALSYRQTLAATKLVWNFNRSVAWNFLKEISTNGDMNTMDVIFPASPMLLYTAPELLKLLLVPVLSYAHNETYIEFGNPYSPHQLGTYPIGDSPTSAQEPMPLENTGNMFFMMLAVVQQQARRDAGAKKLDVSWFYPGFWPMLVRWADELVATTEFPAEQICTDDFTGPLKNNTNLGLKGIVALEAFSQLCRLADAEKLSGTSCAHYSEMAAKYAKTWQQYAFTASPQPHYKMSFNDLPGISDSWSIKYNLLWQKLLRLDGPFPLDKVVPIELAYYRSKANKFGVPMDPRHTYVKTDWLSWIAAMAPSDAEFHEFFDPIFDALNTTADRNPFTDLYNTVNAHQAGSQFIARPVVGGIFAKILLDETTGDEATENRVVDGASSVANYI